MGYVLFKKAKRWPGGRVPYEIDGQSFPAGTTLRTDIDTALTNWNNDTILDFVPRNGEGDFIRIVPDEANTRSAVGRSGGGQKVVLAAYPGIPDGAPISAIHQRSDQVDCFYVDDSGAIRVIWVDGAGEWDGPVALTPPNTVQLRATLATGRQTADQIDLFFVDRDGAVNVMWVVGNGTWNGPLRLTDPEKKRVSRDAVLVTARQTNEQLDLFFIDADGAVNVMWAVGTGTWSGPLELAPAGSAWSGGSLATAPQTDGQLNLFYVDNTSELGGAITVVSVVGGTWGKPVALTGRGSVSIVAPLATARQTDDQINLFYVGHDGAVNVMWVVGNGEWHAPQSITRAGIATSGAALATARQTDDQIDLFFVGPGDIVNVMWAVGKGTWNGPVGLTPGGTAPNRGALATARPTEFQLGLFYIGTNNRLAVMWVVGSGKWGKPVVFEPEAVAVGEVMHKLGHAIGLKHEHARPDSADFVEIVGGTPPNYGPAPDCAPVGPYDCESIMHYPPSTTPPTLRVRDPRTCVRVGQRNGLSAGDIATADYAYGRVTTAGAALASQHRTKDQLDLAFADRFGAIAVLSVEGVGVWEGPFEVTPAGIATPGTRVAAAGQTKEQVDLFFVDDDGAFSVTWVIGTGAWQPPVALTPPDTIRGGDTALVTARQPDDQLDLFFIDRHGAIHVTWVIGTGIWQPSIALRPSGTVEPRASLATANQTSDQLNLFYVDTGGAIHVMWVVGTGTWQPPVALRPSGTAEPGASLATANQTSDQLNLFYVDTGGAIHVMWVVGTGIWQPPVALTPPGTVEPGARLATVRQTSDQLNLFFIDTHGAIHVTWVVGTGTWEPPIALTPTGTAPANAALTATWQTDDQIDLFFADEHGAIHVMWVVGTGKWNAPVGL